MNPSAGLSRTEVSAATPPAMAHDERRHARREHAGHARRFGVGGGGAHGEAVAALAQEHDEREDDDRAEDQEADVGLGDEDGADAERGQAAGLREVGALRGRVADQRPN